MTKDVIWLSGLVGQGDPTVGKGMSWTTLDGESGLSFDGQIDADADGVYTSNNNIIVDLSDMCSQIVGRQCPMTANYRVTGIHMSMRNVDDANDNNTSTVLQGVVAWRKPTSHLIDAVQAHRTALKAASMDGIDTISDYYIQIKHTKGSVSDY